MANNIEIEVRDLSREVIEALENAVQRGLDAGGGIAEKGIKKIIKDEGRIGLSSRYYNSITHQTEENTCYVGTNVRYAIYNELGTGIYASEGGGRQTPWCYEDEEGKWHWTRGMKPIHAVKNGTKNNEAEIIAIIKESLENA